MQKRTSLTTLTALMIAAYVCAGVPPPLPEWATIAYPDEVSVFITFDGDGNRLDACRTMTSSPGTTVDATITITAIDMFTGVPIVGLAAEDFWLETDAAGLTLCAIGFAADGPTDGDGITTMTGAPLGGGYSNREADEETYVVCMGDRVHSNGFDLRFNSADINGDLMVTLHDVILFCQLFGTHEYHYAIDFYFDGVIGLSDLIYFMQSMNTQCE